ncbi:hypothetical protein LTR40_012862, partial [Exophiala xenobiotica]
MSQVGTHLAEKGIVKPWAASPGVSETKQETIKTEEPGRKTEQDHGSVKREYEIEK